MNAGENRLTAASLFKVALAIVVSSVVAHYLLQVFALAVGGRPDFTDTLSLGINVAVMAFFLALGWLLRRMTLVSLIYLGLGTAFFVSLAFTTKGSFAGWAIQFATYIFLPLGSLAIFKTLGRVAEIPERPAARRKKSPGPTR